MKQVPSLSSMKPMFLESRTVLAQPHTVTVVPSAGGALNSALMSMRFMFSLL